MTEFSAANGSFALVASPQIESSPGMVFDMNGPGGVGPESYRRDSQLAVGTLTADRGTQYYEPEAQPSLDDVRRIYFSRDPGTVTYYSIRGGYVRWWHGAWWR